MRLRLVLDDETAACLRDAAFRELRTVDREAIALLRAGLGLPMPYPAGVDEPDPARAPAGV